MHAGGIGRINKDGVDYYHRLIDYMIGNRKHNDLGLPLCSCHGDITFLRMQIWRHVKTRHVFFFCTRYYSLCRVVPLRPSSGAARPVQRLAEPQSCVSVHDQHHHLFLASNLQDTFDHACGACHFAGKISPSSRIFASRRTVTV